MKNHSVFGKKVLLAKEEDVPVGTLESYQRLYLALFSIDLRCDWVTVKCSVYTEVIAQRAAMRLPHGGTCLSRSIR